MDKPPIDQHFPASARIGIETVPLTEAVKRTLVSIPVY